MVPVLGGEVEEGEQRFAVLAKAGDRIVVLGIAFVSEHNAAMISLSLERLAEATITNF